MKRTATWRGQVVAQSDRTVDVDGYCYFPRDSVRMDLLKVSPKTPSDQQCPHGVQFYDVGTDKGRSARNAWSYEKPGAAMKSIERYLGFWDEVEVK